MLATRGCRHSQWGGAIIIYLLPNTKDKHTGCKADQTAKTLKCVISDFGHVHQHHWLCFCFVCFLKAFGMSLNFTEAFEVIWSHRRVQCGSINWNLWFCGHSLRKAKLVSFSFFLPLSRWGEWKVNLDVQGADANLLWRGEVEPKHFTAADFW